MSVGEQVFDFIIREGAVCFQAEHGQTALRVVAADDLAVKLHRPRSALGTLAAGIPAGEQLVARQQFGGNFPCICLNLPAEVIGGQFPTLDACQFLFPFARHGDIGNTHRLHDRVEGKPFFGGDKRLLAAFHIAALEKRFDDGRTGGGRADAAILHSLPQCVVLYLLASRFHRGQQGGFGMQRLGFGLSLRDGGGFQCQRVAFLPTGNGGGFLLAVVLFSILLAIDGTPSGLPDDAAFCHELHSGTLCRDGGSVLDAFFGEIETEDTPKDYLSVEELYKLAETPCKKPILKTAALFSCLTSLRISDILSLQWHEIVDFAAGGKCVHTITQKTKTEDIIPISDEALQLIGYSPEKTGLVFKGLKRSWTQQPMKEWIREAGITKNITFHSYRRTYATLQGAAGTDIRTIQSNMAHKSITTTQRYMKVVDSNKREASNRISLIRK